MSGKVVLGCLIALISSLAVTASASAAFGAHDFNLRFINQDGSSTNQAGSHPFGLGTDIQFNSVFDQRFEREVPDGNVKDLIVNLPPGFAGTAVGLPQCTSAEFLQIKEDRPNCSNGTAVGASVTQTAPGQFHSPVYNLTPPPGVIVKIGYYAFTTPVFINIELSHEAPYHLIARLGNVSQAASVRRGYLQVWGVPADAVHDPFRGHCLSEGGSANLFEEFASNGVCETNAPKIPLIAMPTSCRGPILTDFALDSWQDPGAELANGEPDLSDPAWFSGQEVSHDESEPPLPQGVTGCDRLGFGPSVEAVPTTKAAQSPTGLDFALNVQDEGFTNPSGLAQSDIKSAEVTLPEGFTANPSFAEGLNVCTEADLARETVGSLPGAGCPNESKIGTVEVESPAIDEPVDGALYIAKPYENSAGNSLLGLYIVIKNPRLGIIIKQPLRIVPNPATGQLVAFAEEIPELPFSHFKLHFREGTRSPLASGPLCGEYAARAVLTPWSGSAAVTTSSMFSIISGPDSGPCPTGGTPPFHPGLEAGTVNNAAGKYSPFYVHLTRNDGEQEITHFSIKLPPGVIGKLAGIPFCPDAAIAAATARTGPHGGQEEIERPSCPATSEVGHTLVGAGVGPSLAYAPGKLYLAGPYHGSQISLVSVTAAKVGPFDLGTVVVRFALKINPETAEVFVDAAGSDPLPHIIKGIPVHLRDIRAYVDRPNFVLNPTSCERTSTASTVLGSGTNFASEADDQPITVTSPFQAASCASLEFAPKLALSLKGGTKRNANPAFKAVLTPRKGDANIGSARVTLPHSEFLDNAHIKTICTRVQFNAGGGNGEKCPKASIYGKAKAVTPLLDEPLSGPVYLRSSSHKLPDLVAALHSGEINIDLDGKIDSAKGGRIRNTFEAVPDAPVTKFTLEMFGGKKSLLVNSTNLCKGSHKAIAEFTGQNGKQHNFGPELKAQCGKKKGKKGKSGAKGKKGSKSSALGLVDFGWYRG